jgi:hypothetical protein
MALPPEPIDELLPKSDWVVEAEVKEVLQQATPLPASRGAEGATSIGHKVGAQLVRLRVTRVLRGKPATELVVEKPAAGYALKPGNKGPFLISAGEGHPVILGRYGPDSYALARIEAALR